MTTRKCRFLRSKSVRFTPLLVGGLLVAGSLACVAAAPKSTQPSPEAKISFERLGIPGLSANFLSAGSSMLTVHFVDSSHMLVSYGARDLVPRIVGDPPEDDDRIVAAELLELPTGKILARTRWHLHDHGRYLWNLGEGRFLLREGSALWTFAPLANLAAKEPFARTPFPHRRGVTDAVVVSPDGKLLTLESHMPLPKKKPVSMDISSITFSGDPPPKPVLVFDFYRLYGSGAETSPIHAMLAGTVQSTQPARLPLDGDGYLVASGGKRGQWSVDFQGFGTKGQQVGAVVSGCSPTLELVSSTQWLAFACRGATAGAVTVAAYDFAKHEIWEEPMGTSPMEIPALAVAPAASRFAISRRLEQASHDTFPTEEQTGPAQEVRVYGTQTGDLLLKVNCSPTFRTPENFDLSPDGMRLVVVRNGALEIYRLPELTKEDRADLADLEKMTPPPGSGPVDLRRLGSSPGTETQGGPDVAREATPSSAPATVSVAPATGAPVPDRASAVPATEAQAPANEEVPRKPPTLLNPGEKAEIKSKPASSRPN